MRPFQWHALQAGDRVSVHGADEGFSVRAGVVTAVYGRFKRQTVGVVLDGRAADGTEDLCWPNRLEVHLDPRDASEPCWRCDASPPPAARS